MAKSDNSNDEVLEKDMKNSKMEADLLKTAYFQLKASADRVKEREEELQTMNMFMIDREVKMAELKKENEHLLNRIAELEKVQ